METTFLAIEHTNKVNNYFSKEYIVFNGYGYIELDEYLYYELLQHPWKNNYFYSPEFVSNIINTIENVQRLYKQENQELAIIIIAKIQASFKNINFFYIFDKKFGI